jgi:hypothetical protein
MNFEDELILLGKGKYKEQTELIINKNKSDKKVDCKLYKSAILKFTEKMCDGLIDDAPSSLNIIFFDYVDRSVDYLKHNKLWKLVQDDLKDPICKPVIDASANTLNSDENSSIVNQNALIDIDLSQNLLFENGPKLNQDIIDDFFNQKITLDTMSNMEQKSELTSLVTKKKHKRKKKEFIPKKKVYDLSDLNLE